MHADGNRTTLVMVKPCPVTCDKVSLNNVHCCYFDNSHELEKAKISINISSVSVSFCFSLSVNVMNLWRRNSNSHCLLQ